MPTTSQSIATAFPVIVTVSMVLITVLLAVISVLLWRRRKDGISIYQVPVASTDLSDLIAQFKQSAEHHVDVSAVVSMMRQLDKLDADALALLKCYPATVRATAWVHHINYLGADLQDAQEQLSDAHRGVGDYSELDYYNLTREQERRQQHVDAIRAKLDRAIELSGQSGLRTV